MKKISFDLVKYDDKTNEDYDYLLTVKKKHLMRFLKSNMDNMPYKEYLDTFTNDDTWEFYSFLNAHNLWHKEKFIGKSI
ncbi:hypothetical protein [Carnobacterium maltaromaticum]|uniref:Uncharacterized protein n=1 Tax=Carnobacterium maltaromaticum TaxID=2751 RepID=A0AAW9JYI1_CARML|nr:hypothetical protein [Carnobacterium maltaromaticum]MDZ5760698.1 hypothetical protein [Carnobacterium maltaromaticum]CAD5903013.1 hypothetical protein CMALT394_60035 [Carnobacterium maltaromaticum]